MVFNALFKEAKEWVGITRSVLKENVVWRDSKDIRIRKKAPGRNNYPAELCLWRRGFGRRKNLALPPLNLYNTPLSFDGKGCYEK